MSRFKQNQPSGSKAARGGRATARQGGFQAPPVAAPAGSGGRSSPPVVLGGQQLHDVIAPDSIVVHRDCMEIGDRFVRTLFVSGVDARVCWMGWLNDLYAYPGNIDIATYISSFDSRVVIKKLNQKITQMEVQLNRDARAGKIEDIYVLNQLQECRQLRDELQQGLEKYFYASFYITVSAKSREELDEITRDVEKIMGLLQLRTRSADLRQEKGFLSVLPLAQDFLQQPSNWNSSSLSTCFPPVSAELTNTEGKPILYGINMLNASLVIFDRFEPSNGLPNYNSLVLGTSGSGKSYLTKLEIMRSLIMGTEVFVLDPSREYQPLVWQFGGQYIRLSADSPDRINLLDFEIEDDDGSDGPSVNPLRSAIVGAMSKIGMMISQGRPERALSAIQRSTLVQAIQDAYAEKGITEQSVEEERRQMRQRSRFQAGRTQRVMPQLSDVRRILNEKYGEVGKELAHALFEFCQGGPTPLFDAQTNVDTRSKFIVFDLKDLDKNLQLVGTYIACDFLWSKVKRQKRRRLFVVDEAWMFMMMEESAKFLAEVARTARKFYCGLMVVTQMADDFFSDPWSCGRAIYANTSIQILLRQSPKELDTVADVFKISDSEREFLASARAGDALFYVGSNHTKIRVVASPEEDRIANTNPQIAEQWGMR